MLELEVQKVSLLTTNHSPASVKHHMSLSEDVDLQICSRKNDIRSRYGRVSYRQLVGLLSIFMFGTDIPSNDVHRRYGATLRACCDGCCLLQQCLQPFAFRLGERIVVTAVQI
jgi:hypothetical protein